MILYLKKQSIQVSMALKHWNPFFIRFFKKELSPGIILFRMRFLSTLFLRATNRISNVLCYSRLNLNFTVFHCIFDHIRYKRHLQNRLFCYNPNVTRHTQSHQCENNQIKIIYFHKIAIASARP